MVAEPNATRASAGGAHREKIETAARHGYLTDRPAVPPEASDSV
jgi:hypothetical protein